MGQVGPVHVLSRATSLMMLLGLDTPNLEREGDHLMLFSRSVPALMRNRDTGPMDALREPGLNSLRREKVCS